MERQTLLSSKTQDDDRGGETVIEMDRLPPRWVDISDATAAQLQTIARKSVQLDQLHRKHVLPSFEPDSVRQAEERQIERLTREITGLFLKCKNEIQRIQRMVDGDARTPQAELAIARNVQTDLASKVADASAAFRKKQSRYLEKLGALGNYAPLDPPKRAQNGYVADASLLDSEADQSYSESMLQQTQKQARLHSNDAAIAQREKEINDIAQGIIELATLFRDLQGMVIDQGTLLDRIDFNVESLRTDVKEAAKEVTTARGYQKRTTRRKIMLLLVLLIVGAIILLTLKPRHRDGGQAPPPVPVPSPSPKPDDKKFLVGDGVKDQPLVGLVRRITGGSNGSSSAASLLRWERKRRRRRWRRAF